MKKNKYKNIKKRGMGLFKSPSSISLFAGSIIALKSSFGFMYPVSIGITIKSPLITCFTFSKSVIKIFIKLII